jgi:hypothetical protein
VLPDRRRCTDVRREIAGALSNLSLSKYRTLQPPIGQGRYGAPMFRMALSGESAKNRLQRCAIGQRIRSNADALAREIHAQEPGRRVRRWTEDRRSYQEPSPAEAPPRRNRERNHPCCQTSQARKMNAGMHHDDHQQWIRLKDSIKNRHPTIASRPL